VVESTLQEYALLIDQGFGDEDISSIYRLKSGAVSRRTRLWAVEPPVNNTLRIATRKSQLALWQAEHVAELLRRRTRAGRRAGAHVHEGRPHPGPQLAAIGGKGLFIKELESAMEDGRADIAVHSMKDVPADCRTDS
jgi:hypothetical protein